MIIVNASETRFVQRSLMWLGKRNNLWSVKNLALTIVKVSSLDDFEVYVQS